MSPTLDRRHAIASLAGFGIAGIASAQALATQSTPTADPSLDITGSIGGAVIAVSATGRASAPADRAIGQLVVRNQYGGKDPKGPMPADAAATPEVSSDVASMFVDALIEAGVAEASIVTIVPDETGGSSYFGPGTAVVVFQVEGEGIKTLGSLLGALTAIALEQGLMYDQPGAMLLSDACQDLRGSAYVDAVAVGQQEATLIADALGVELGELVRAAKQSISFGPASYGMSPSDACDDLVDLGSAVRTYLPPFDPSMTNEFTVYAAIELTFAIA